MHNISLMQTLAAKGYDIMLNGLGGVAEVETALGACQELGSSQVAHHGADLSDPGQIGQLFECIRERWGEGPDILVNNAGK